MSDETALAQAGKAAAQELAKDAAKGLERVAVDLYGDAIRPYARALGNVARVAFLPLEWLAHCAERVRPRVPEEKLVDAAPKVIATPIVQALPAAADEPELSDLYLELLGKSMHKDYQSDVHPAFAKVLGELSPDEARLLSAFSGTYAPALITMATKPGPDQEITERTLYIFVKDHEPLRRQDAFPTYFENFKRLRLLEVDELRNLPKAVGIVEEIVNLGRWRKNMQAAGLIPTAKHALVEVTPFGRGFLNACLPPGSVTTFGIHARAMYTIDLKPPNTSL